MTISSTTNRNNYSGNGSTATYAYTYKITADTDVLLTVTDADGNETTLTRVTHYTVTGVGNANGNVVLVNGAFAWIDSNGFLKTGYDLTIRRVRPIKQLTDIRNQGSFYPETHEDALDNLCMIDQQQQDEIDRSFKLPESIDPADFDASMPTTLPANPGATFIVNATGDGFSLGPTASAISSAQAHATAAAAAKTAAEAAQTAAESAQTAAEAAQTAAESAETGAVSAQGSAESARDLAQNYADALKGTSVSSNSIGTGAKTFTTQTGKQFVAGQFVVVVDQASTANYMVGQVTSYSGSTLVIDSQSVGGSGTKTAWNIAIAGSVGPTGSTGATGTAGLNFLSGAGAPSDGTGVNNDMYLNTTNWDVYKKAAGTWGSPIGNIKGATGDTGATGASGDGKFNTATTTVKTDNYTVQSSDFGNVLVMNNASAKAFTLPNITTASVIILKNIGAGVCTITPDASDTCETASLAQNENCILVADTTNNVWRNVTKASGTGDVSQAELNVVRDNIMLIAFRQQVGDSVSVQKMEDGVADEFEDETGVDTVGSTNENYDSVNDFYKPATSVDANTVFLAAFLGSDGAVAYTAETGQAITFAGTAKLDTAQYKFAPSSLLLDGDSDYVTVPDNANLEFGSGNFTVDAFVRLNALPADGAYMVIAGKYNGTDDQRSWYFAISRTGASYYLQFVISTNGQSGTLTTYTSSAISIATGAWHHFAFVRNGVTGTFYYDGVASGTADMTGKTLFDSNKPLQIGAINTTPYAMLNGWISDVRISNSARWTSGFTPPISSSASALDMSLKSQSFTASSQPSQARIVLWVEDINSVTINTDIKGYVSRDGGSTYSEVTLADEGYSDGTIKRIISGTVDISAQPAGTSMVWKVDSRNLKSFKLHAVGIAWK